MTCQSPDAQVRDYVLGNGVLIRASLINVLTGETIDANDLRLFVKSPTDVVTEVAMTAETGDEIAQALYVPDAAGTWWYRVEADTLADAAYEHSFRVTAPNVNPP